MRATKLLAIAACAVATAAPLAAQVIDGPGDYSTFGDATFGPNGTQQRFGDTTFAPEGTYQRFGNTTFGYDGTSFQSFGDTSFGSNGTTSQTFGNTSFITGPNGQHMTCQRFGAQIICN